MKYNRYDLHDLACCLAVALVKELMFTEHPYDRSLLLLVEAQEALGLTEFEMGDLYRLHGDRISRLRSEDD